MPKFLMTVYAAAAYALFSAVFVFFIAFVGDFPVPKTIDSGIGGTLGQALVTDLLLISVFGLQHSVMARPGFKRWWTRIVPEPVERSTFVLAATLTLGLVMWQWKPIAEPVLWALEPGLAATALDALFWIGWGLVMLSTFLINHFELFGLRQAYAHLMGRAVPAQEFVTPLLYRHVRHPLYLGFVTAFWATPRMTLGHLLFAVGWTAYVFIGIYFEERDLVAHFGDRYRRYCEQAGMLLPSLRRKRP